VPDSLISPGVIVSGSQVRASVLSPGVRVHDGSWVDGSVLAHGAVVGPGAVVRRAILDKNVVVGPGQRVGVDREQDLARGATISAGGITVYGKGIRIA
jgi:glucose-1-phosphate adenylyltransferase